MVDNQSEDKQKQIWLVESRQVSDWLNLSGTIQPIAWYEINGGLTSYVSQLHFSYGEVVKQGQLLVSLDTSEQQNKLRQSTASLIQAQLASEKLQNWPYRPEVLRAKRQLNQAKAQLINIQRQLKETQRLYDIGIVSGLELENLKISLRAQQQSVIGASEFLTETLASGGQSQQRIAALNLTNATQIVNAIKQNLKKAQIFSPIDGIVFRAVEDKKGERKSKLHVGSVVSSNLPVLAIADFSGIAIEFQVPEAQLLSLQQQQEAIISVDALADISITGKISYISGRASKGNAKGEAKQAPQFAVEVSSENISTKLRNQLRIGMSASVRIKIYHNPTAIVIPFEALIIEGEARFVNVINDNGQQQRRAVHVRNTLVDGVEIDGGLVVGEQLLIDEASL